MAGYINISHEDIKTLLKKLEQMGERLNEREETILMGIFDLAQKALSMQKGSDQSQGQSSATAATGGQAASATEAAEQNKSEKVAAALDTTEGGLGGEAVTSAAASFGAAPAPAATTPMTTKSQKSIPGTPKKKLVLEKQTLRNLNIWDKLLSVEAHSLWTCNGKPVIPGQEVINPGTNEIHR